MHVADTQAAHVHLQFKVDCNLISTICGMRLGMNLNRFLQGHFIEVV